MNEIIIVLSVYIIMQFFDTTIETPTRNALGSMLIALTVILILLNLSFIIYQVKVTVWKRLVKMMADKNEMAKLKEKADAQTNIATGNDVNSDIEIFESVKFCKYWHSHRNGLKPTTSIRTSFQMKTSTKQF